MGMTMRERKPYYREVAKRYQKAGKKEKGVILDEFVATVGLNRSYASTLLRNHGKVINTRRGIRLKGDITKGVKRRGRRKYYDDDVFQVIRKLWMVMDCICGKRLKTVLDEVVENMINNNRLEIKQDVKIKLSGISASTIDRMLVKERKKISLKGRATTKPGTLLKNSIPIRTFAEWNEDKPGFTETDLVSHEGGNPRGDFAFSLNITDINTGWVEPFCIKNKAAIWVKNAIDYIKNSLLPFDLLGIDTDSGSEFINQHLFKYCKDNQITFTRSRSYKKNDNCYIEQKNYTVVRRAVGYYRYDSDLEVQIINELYENLRLYVNHFQPSMKLKEKIRIGSKVKKIYSLSQTPYRRVMESPHILDEKKLKLKKIHDSLDVYLLKKNITNCQKKLLQIQKQKMNLGEVSTDDFQVDFNYEATI